MGVSKAFEGPRHAGQATQTGWEAMFHSDKLASLGVF